jgi:hypothetical protein
MTTMPKLIRTAAILTLAGALGLSACNRTSEKTDAVEPENMITELPIENATTLNSTEATSPAPEPDNATNTASVAPPPAFSDKDQIRDDADATGLTSRLPVEGTPGPVANEVQPAK